METTGAGGHMVRVGSVTCDCKLGVVSEQRSDLEDMQDVLP